MKKNQTQNQKNKASQDLKLDFEGAMVAPIFQTSNFYFESWDDISKAFDNRTDSYIYSRGNNPTVEIAQKKIAEMAGGEKALLFGSGMAAISAAVMHSIEKDSHIIAVKNIYGPANNLIFNYLNKKMNVSVSFVPGDDINEFKAALRPNTSLVYLESPSSGTFILQDIKAITTWAKKNNIKTVMDNTWATPYFQKPLSMGVDLEIHSCSKYLGGHSDVVAGVLIGAKDLIERIFEKEYEWLGGRISPMEAWLITRSLKTLPMRMKTHEANALEVARFLENHPKVLKVNYPGLKSFAQYKLAQEQMSGNSGLLSFRLATQDLEKVKKFFNGLNKFRIGVSWGGHESLIYALAISYIKEMKEEQFAATGLTYGDMRISVGLDPVTELIKDLEQALELI